jgi:hypothetical protein
LVDAVSRLTKGEVTDDRKLSGPTTKLEMESAFFIASLLGTNSPKTRVKYDNIIVIRITEIFLSQTSGT